MSRCLAGEGDSSEEMCSSSGPKQREWKNEEPEVYDQEDVPSRETTSSTQESNPSPPTLDPNPAAEERACSICWEAYIGAGESSQLFLNCGHSFCQGCLRSVATLALKTRTKAVRIACPDRACDMALDDGLVGRLLTAQERATLERVRRLAELNHNPNLRYCPQPKCSAMVATAGPLQPCAKCPACRHEFCFFCLQEWHGVQKTCQEFAEELEKRMDGKLNETLAMKEWFATGCVKKCPGCLTPIMKNGGCRHMTCEACAFEYCWVCLDDWRPNLHTTCEHLYIDAFGKKAAMPKRLLNIPDIFYPQKRSPTEIEALLHQLEKRKTSWEGRANRRPSLMSRLRAHFTDDRRPKKQTLRAEGEFRFVTTGARGTGKSGLANRFCYNYFIEDWPYDLVSKYKKQVDGAQLHLMEIVGMQDLEHLPDEWLASAEAFIVTFSPDVGGSIEHARGTILKILRVKGETVDEAAIVLAGTKCDLFPDGALSDSLMLAREMAVKFQCPLIFTSSREDVNVDTVFMEVVRQAIRRRRMRASRPLLTQAIQLV